VQSDDSNNAVSSITTGEEEIQIKLEEDPLAIPDETEVSPQKKKNV
jgi:hypothetical protein